MNGTYTADQNMTVVGRTGAIVQVPVGSGSALELRGGPTIRYNDALRPDRTKDQASVLLEVQAKYPLLGGIGLEYSGAALPAMTSLDRPKLNQSLGLAIPVSGGKLKLGASITGSSSSRVRPPVSPTWNCSSASRSAIEGHDFPPGSLGLRRLFLDGIFRQLRPRSGAAEVVGPRQIAQAAEAEELQELAAWCRTAPAAPANRRGRRCGGGSSPSVA